MKILCIGHSSYDIACMIDSYPVENSKNTVTEKLESGGGQVANAACLLGKWGAETYLAAAVGQDSYGDKIKKELEMHGVKQDYLETIFDKSTSVSFVLSNRTNASRTIMSIATDDATPRLKKEEGITIEPDVILVDGYEYNASITILNKYQNKITVIDAGKVNSEVTELCKLCKYIVASKDFAEGVTNIKVDYNNPQSLLAIYNKLKERYPKANIIITLEEKGALYVNNNQVKVMPGIKIAVKDTTAAGDIFHGAFVYGLANNYDIEKTIAFSNIAAGLSCSETGGRQSIPNLNSVISYYNSKIGVQNVQPPQPQPQMQQAQAAAQPLPESLQQPNPNINQPQP